MDFENFPEIIVIIDRNGIVYEKEERNGESIRRKRVEPDGAFDIRNGLAEIFHGKGSSGFYEIIWDMGKFLLASDEGYDKMKEELKKYVSHGRGLSEKKSREANPSRPKWMSPDDSTWLVEYLERRGIKSRIICPKENIIRTYSVME